jgi:hypothetical protein
VTIEELAGSIERLARATEDNTTAQQESARTLAGMGSEFRTWKETRCDDHHRRIETHEEAIADLRVEVSRAIARAAGAVGAVTFIVTILATKLSKLLIGG